MQAFQTLVVARRTRAVATLRSWLKTGTVRRKLITWIENIARDPKLPKISISIVKRSKTDIEGHTPMPKRSPKDDYLDTHELEAFLDGLKGAAEKDKVAERERLTLTLKQTLEQAVAAARNAVKDADAELDAAPRHLRADYEAKLAVASARLAALMTKLADARAIYAF